MKDLRILIADDHPLLLKGLLDFLVEQELDVIYAANDGLDAFNNIVKLEPTLAILDVRMPKMTGIEVVRKIKNANIKTKTIIITMYNESSLFNEAVRLGVDGILLKENTLSEILQCLETIISGQKYISEKIRGHREKEGDSIISKMSTSEIKILRLIAKDLTSKEIADRLFISPKTIEKHRTNILKKLNISGKTNSLLLWVKQNEELLMQ